MSLVIAAGQESDFRLSRTPKRSAMHLHAMFGGVHAVHLETAAVLIRAYPFPPLFIAYVLICA
jgi:hypothetical protein